MKWEYKKEEVKGIFDSSWSGESIKSYGREGWELVSIYEGEAYFKRPFSLYKQIKRSIGTLKWRVKMYNTEVKLNG